MSASNAEEQNENQQKSGRFSLQNLSAAFSQLTSNDHPKSVKTDAGDLLDDSQRSVAAPDNKPLSPRMIVEGMLFVSNAEGRPLTCSEMATHIRDVSPQEIELLIDELNSEYSESASPYRIVSDGSGYRMALHPAFESTRQRFFGRVREAKLTTPALEVLSIVAYRQPIEADEISKLRAGRSQALLSQLVRRGLLRLERPTDSPRKPVYHTTDRFNTLFGVDSLNDLPSSEDLDDR